MPSQSNTFWCIGSSVRFCAILWCWLVPHSAPTLTAPDVTPLFVSASYCWRMEREEKAPQGDWNMTASSSRPTVRRLSLQGTVQKLLRSGGLNFVFQAITSELIISSVHEYLTFYDILEIFRPLTSIQKIISSWGKGWNFCALSKIPHSVLK